MGNRLGLIDDFNYILKLVQIRAQIRDCFFSRIWILTGEKCLIRIFTNGPI